MYKLPLISIKRKKMRFFYLFSLSFFSLLSFGFAENSSVDRFFQTESLKTASYSVYAIDAKTGEIICKTAQRSLSPASVMKLFTTAVALDMLGPDYTFSTSLAYSGNIDPQNGTLSGNLILKGGGDPAFYSSFFEDHYKDCFEDWIKQLKTSGIKKINGNLLIDLSAMDRTSIPGGWSWEDIGNYYGAGVSALSFCDNLYEIHFVSPKTEGKEATIKTKNPVIEGLILENRVRSSAISGDHTIVYGAPGSNQQCIEGTIPTGQADFIVKAAMPDPPVVAGLTFLKKIKEHGIQFSGGVARLPADDNTKKTLLGTKLSPPLKDLIIPLNKESLNLFAEHLLREIGRKSSGEPSITKGIEAFYQFCADKGINSEGFFPVDGSGLSRNNALTSQTLVEMLKYVYDSKQRELFLNALPIAGIDGTLRNSFKGTPLEKNVKAKTGSMARVRSIAGILETKSKKTILFAILINNFDLTSSEASKLLESILMSFYNGSKP